MQNERRLPLGYLPERQQVRLPHGHDHDPHPRIGQYCIDSIEVTYAAYKLFINSNPNIGTQPAYCTWNTTYVPSAGWPRPLARRNFARYID